MKTFSKLLTLRDKTHTHEVIFRIADTSRIELERWYFSECLPWSRISENAVKTSLGDIFAHCCIFARVSLGGRASGRPWLFKCYMLRWLFNCRMVGHQEQMTCLNCCSRGVTNSENEFIFDLFLWEVSTILKMTSWGPSMETAWVDSCSFIVVYFKQCPLWYRHAGPQFNCGNSP